MSVIRIVDLPSAVAYLESVNDYDFHNKRKGDAVVFSAACGKCGGRGYGHWFQDGGICYQCNGANTSNNVKSIPLTCHAKAVKTKIAAEKRNEVKKIAKHSANLIAKIEGQKNWCEKNGHGAITFEELKVKQDAEKLVKQDKLVHVGTVGKREVFKLKLEAMISFESFFGLKILHKFSDVDGNQLVWWTSDWFGEKGEEFEVKATVKAHEEYNGAKQTVLSRVKNLAPAPAVADEVRLSFSSGKNW